MDDEPLPVSEDAAKIADAESLFREAPASKPEDTAKGHTSAESAGVYEFAANDAPVLTSPSPPPVQAKKSSKSKPPPRPVREPDEAVAEVWTRQGEWGATLATVAAAALGLSVVLFVLLSFGQYAVAFLALLLGGVAIVLLSYPILITLERPVRITPEQAVRDYYAALSHHVPHLRRMWLLLSAEGKVSGSFTSLEGFRIYWKERLRTLKGGRAGGFTPLKFKVENFRAEKSAGKSEVEASYTVTVAVRGRSGESPIETVPVEATLVKGPDDMWYLDRGTLP